jgi:hypothetical protein
MQQINKQSQKHKGLVGWALAHHFVEAFGEIKSTLLFALFCFYAILSAGCASTGQKDAREIIKVAPQAKDSFFKAIADVNVLVFSGQTDDVRSAYDALREDFPDVDGPDLDMYIKADVLLSQQKLTRSAQTYDKMLTDFPKSILHEQAVAKEFYIGNEFLSGRPRIVLGFIPISGLAEGIGIMEKVTDHAGISSQTGTQAAIMVAEIYEQQGKFSEAYLKWWEVNNQWHSGILGRDSLLGMARTKHAQYNKNPENKRPFYDASCLRSARSYYEKFKSTFPKDAQELDVEQTLREIYEQLAEKDLVIGMYYHRTGSKTAANLYLDMVISDWPQTQAAQTAKEIRLNDSDIQK